MFAQDRTKKLAAALLGVAMVTSISSPFIFQPAAAASVGDPAFARVWDRADKPVQDRMALRSWTWGPEPFQTAYEPYAQGVGGQHLVTYFDKSRMEINDPSADRNSQWFVTNGLLVVDMISGRYQVGNEQFVPASPANVPVAGDTGASIHAPTYASLKSVASLNGDHRAANRAGQSIREGLGRDGNIGLLDNLAGYSRYGTFEPTTGHNIADVFWTFLNQHGVVYENGQYKTAALVDWLFAMGYPITEPYWIQISVGGQERWVLMQAFQRRILTFTPSNPDSWKVEMGNVGRAYFDWRYAQTPVPPAPTPTATAVPGNQVASISISPASGDTNTQITVTGKRFPAFSAVTISAERPDANYSAKLATVAAKSDGTFSVKLTIPANAARLGSVNLVAAANGGAVKASAGFRLSYNPSVQVSPVEIVTNGVVHITGAGFPAASNVDLGAQFNGGSVTWLARTRTDNSGEFEADLAIGDRPAGTTFKVIALADGGYRAGATVTNRVLGQPSLQALPVSGPAGVNVTLRGTNWPPNRGITLGLRASDTVATGWIPGQVTTDASGNFAVPVFIGPEYAEKAEVRLIASEPVSTFRMETSYRVIAAPTPTPVPGQASVQISPNVLVAGQAATATGANWQAAGIVQVGIGRPGMGVEEWIGSVRATGARTFSLPFILSQRWANAGQLTVTAIIPNSKMAVTTVTVVQAGGRIVPGGLPMTVSSYTHAGTTQVKINSNSWTAGSVVDLSVVSADGSVNLPVTTAAANASGVLGANFNLTVAMAARNDLGVKAAGANGTQFSLRYLPITTATKVQGTSNTYTVTGANWPAGTAISVVIGTTDELKGEGAAARTIITGPVGEFSFTINVPRLPGNQKADLQLQAVNQPYSATFDW